MRLRTLIGFGIGYALGAKSDPKKFEELQQMVQGLQQSPIFHAVLEQAKKTAANGMETLTGQQPPWAESKSGNGQQAPQKAQQQVQQQSQQSEESNGDQSEQSDGGQQETSGKEQESSGKEQESSGKQQKQSTSKSS